MKTLVRVMCVGVIFVATSIFAQDKDESCVGAKVVVTNAVVKHVSKPDRQKYYSGLSDKNNIKKRVGLAVIGLCFLLKGILGGKEDSKDEN